MHSHLSPYLLLSFLTIISLSINVPTSLCAKDTRYANCSEPFTCGSIKSIKFPFWGVNRAGYCGKPGFQLECQDNVPLITMISEKYRILLINPQVQTLIVAREDFWNNICPQNFVNTALNFTLFNYAVGIRNLTLFYGCTFFSGPISTFSSPYNCTVNNTDINFFYVMRNITIDPRLGSCNSSVVIPVFERAAQALETNTTTIGGAIDGGFGLKYLDLDSDQCSTCVKSGGECGYNWTESRFTCFCHDQPNAKACLTRPSYPFWGGNQANYCGYPGFQVNCQGNAPLLTIASTGYRVLGINSTTRILTVARQDFWNTTCPQYLSATTINSSLFSNSNTQNVTLHYNCPPPLGTTPPPNMFLCYPNGTATATTNYYTATDINVPNIGTCTNDVIVPVSQSSAQSLARNPPSITLEEALDDGFELLWTSNIDALCSSCVQSGGRCGYNPSSGSFTCYCADQPYASVCGNGTGMCL
ncbi:hypothetical protein F0562_005305 [Nyssa sinensis]|uniref:non-specific serine/threonine protein kinase n=1 Tax=Nyssa sinensis TaxID=561372 RepID=A0A5J5ALR4_9ASTE|nr:hypothetical protein F0562_005305 [Nyssa sinensis]